VGGNRKKNKILSLGEMGICSHSPFADLEIKLDYKALSIKNHFALLETDFVLLFQRWKNFFDRNYIDLFYGDKCLLFKCFRIWGSIDLHFSLEFKVGM
jgi:hypothetical protein